MSSHPSPEPAESTQPVLRAPATRPRRSSGDATRQRLLEAGRIAFARDGFAGTPVQIILDEAGVKPPALYHHFGSKAGLFLAIAEEVYHEFVDALAAATREAVTFEGAIDIMIATAGRLHAANATLAPMAITVQFEARRNPDLRHELTPTLGAFRRYVESVVDLADADLIARAGRRALVLAVSALLNGLSSIAVTLRDPQDFVASADALRLIVGPSVAP